MSQKSAQDRAAWPLSAQLPSPPMTVASAGRDQITVGGENGSPGALPILALRCSFRSHLLRLECAQGLLRSQVWRLAQIAGTVEAGQSSCLVARLSFLRGCWLPTEPVLQETGDGSCVSHTENGSVSLVSYSVGQSSHSACSDSRGGNNPSFNGRNVRKCVAIFNLR